MRRSSEMRCLTSHKQLLNSRISVTIDTNEILCRSSDGMCSHKTSVLKNFVNFTGKNTCTGQTPIQVFFPVKFTKFLRTPIAKNIWVDEEFHPAKLGACGYYVKGA